MTMNWIEFLMKIVIELGGFTAIVISVFKLLGKGLIERLSKRYETILAKELEKYKSDLEFRNHTDKTKFDATFKAFSQIQIKILECFNEIETITPNNNGTICEKRKKINEIEKIIDDYKLCLNANLLLIPKGVYDELEKTLEIFYNQIEAFKKLDSYCENDDVRFWNIDDLNDMKEKAIDLLRENLNSLDLTIN